MGDKKAVLVGINYNNWTQGKLAGCVNDTKTWHNLLTSYFGYPNQVRLIAFPVFPRSAQCVTEGVSDEYVRRAANAFVSRPSPRLAKVLIEDPSVGYERQPTKRNIMAALNWLASGARPGDQLFFQYSGHGTQVSDRSGDEADGQDEALCPVDCMEQGPSGYIVDDELRQVLVNRLPPGATLVVVLDCCHSGTGMDLEYTHRVSNSFSPAVAQIQNNPGAVDTLSSMLGGMFGGGAPAPSYGAPQGGYGGYGAPQGGYGGYGAPQGYAPSPSYGPSSGGLLSCLPLGGLLSCFGLGGGASLQQVAAAQLALFMQGGMGSLGGMMRPMGGAPMMGGQMGGMGGGMGGMLGGLLSSLGNMRSLDLFTSKLSRQAARGMRGGYGYQSRAGPGMDYGFDGQRDAYAAGGYQSRAGPGPAPPGSQGKVILWSGCRDEQTSADAHFSGKAAGAMTYAFNMTIEVMMKSGQRQPLGNILSSLRDFMKQKGFEQVPQLSTNFVCDPATEPFVM
eukprot:tig00001339_g8273.t1